MENIQVLTMEWCEIRSLAPYRYLGKWTWGFPDIVCRGEQGNFCYRIVKSIHFWTGKLEDDGLLDVILDCADWFIGHLKTMVEELFLVGFWIIIRFIGFLHRDTFK